MLSRAPALRLRLIFDAHRAIGPGKIGLLAAIVAEGSISAAARAMRMSYKRAWQLVDELNGCFAMPLVETHKGGKRGGGAALTAEGNKVLAAYRAIERKAHLAAAAEMRALVRLARHPDQR